MWAVTDNLLQHLGTYDAEQAQTAWNRTLEFLRAHLG
jgi:dienelactone hydrolase